MSRYLIIESCDQCPHHLFYDAFYCGYPSYGQAEGGRFIAEMGTAPPKVPEWCELKECPRKG